MRAHAAPSGSSNADVYAATARVDAPLNSSLHVEAYIERSYDKYVVQQAALEKESGSSRLQLGLVRLPFGIYDTRETYASGLINYPIARSDYEYNAVDWGVPGVFYSGGSAQVQVEASGFAGISSGIWNNRNNTGGAAIRLQTFRGDLIVGASRWDGYLSPNSSYKEREAVQMNGVDWRYTRPQLIVRGECLFGVLAGDRTQGWYTDIYYRLPKYGKWSVVGRVEELKPTSSSPTGKQVTLGVRDILAPNLIVSLNWRRNNGSEYYASSWASHTDASGIFDLQIYQKFTF